VKDARAEAFRLGFVVGDEDEDGSAGDPLGEDRLHDSDGRRIKRARGLVEQHQRRIQHQRAGQRQALALARREARRLGDELRLRQAKAGGQSPRPSLVAGGEVVGDLFAPPPGLRRHIGRAAAPCVGGEGGAQLAAQRHRSVIRIQIGDHPQEDALPSAGGTQDGDRFATADVKVEGPPQRVSQTLDEETVAGCAAHIPSPPSALRIPAPALADEQGLWPRVVRERTFKCGVDLASALPAPQPEDNEMKRTISALYETRADAERGMEALKQHGLATEANIHDVEGSDRGGPHGEHGVLGRMHSLFGGHKDAHLYGEGLRRGHVLLTAKVDDSKETFAAEIMDAAQPVNLGNREEIWRAEGWKPPHSRDAETYGEPYQAPTSFGSSINVRSYVAGSTV
jgi:hypothetical protein